MNINEMCVNSSVRCEGCSESSKARTFQPDIRVYMVHVLSHPCDMRWTICVYIITTSLI